MLLQGFDLPVIEMSHYLHLYPPAKGRLPQYMYSIMTVLPLIMTHMGPSTVVYNICSIMTPIPNHRSSQPSISAQKWS